MVACYDRRGEKMGKTEEVTDVTWCALNGEIIVLKNIPLIVENGEDFLDADALIRAEAEYFEKTRPDISERLRATLESRGSKHAYKQTNRLGGENHTTGENSEHE